jgi:hypothetical protein
MASVTVDVDIDEFDDAEIIMAAQERGYCVIVTPEQMQKFHKWDRDKIEEKGLLGTAALARDDLADLLDCIKTRRYIDALSLIERLRFPKFETPSQCAEKYKTQKQGNGCYT